MFDFKSSAIFLFLVFFLTPACEVESPTNGIGDALPRSIIGISLGDHFDQDSDNVLGTIRYGSRSYYVVKPKYYAHLLNVYLDDEGLVTRIKEIREFGDRKQIEGFIDNIELGYADYLDGKVEKENTTHIFFMDGETDYTIEIKGLTVNIILSDILEMAEREEWDE